MILHSFYVAQILNANRFICNQKSANPFHANINVSQLGLKFSLGSHLMEINCEKNGNKQKEAGLAH